VEINKVLEELGLDRRNPFVLNLINGLKEKNKPISQDEFIDIIASRVGETKTRDGLKKTFALFDKDENGVIDFDEFKGIAKQLHDAINDDDILEMLHSTHVNHKTATNEGFTFDEFYSIVSKFNNK
jgi:Ca2+-binding EF-hand superfamily protein